MRSFRGAEKRYEIKADPATMTAWDVVQIFEDPQPPVAQNAKDKETATYEYENTYCELLKDFLASEKICDHVNSIGSGSGSSSIAWT